MFSKNKVALKVRKSIECLYKGKCNVIEHKKMKKENKAIGFVDEVIFENEPCRLSFSTSDTTTDNNGVSAKEQKVTLFLAPEHEIKAGSKIVVTQENRTTAYKSSGVPKIYASHQEIALELFERWS